MMTKPRIGPVAAAMMVVAIFAAFAQRERRLFYPADKVSPYPVQPNQRPLSAPTPVSSEQEQKRRWDERTRNPAAEPK